MNIIEKYDPNQPVCGNQADFNIAVREAIKSNNENAMKKAKPWLVVSAILLLVFLIWAVFLAMQIPAGPERTEHLLFAIVFSPAYVLAYYLGIMNNKARMGMCGCNSRD